MNVTELQSNIASVNAISTQLLNTVEVLDPGVAVSAETEEQAIALAAQLAAAAIAAFSSASGTPITPESIMALLPNQTPLSAPDA